MSTDLNMALDFAPDQRLAIARLTFEAFGDAGRLLRQFLGNKSKAEGFIATSLQIDRLIVASRAGSVVGFAGLEYSGRGFLEIDLRDAVNMLGLRGFLVYMVLWIVTHFNKSVQSELNIRALAVSADKRGKGIGAKLLHDTINYARLRGFYDLKLEVTGVNSNAKRLYEKIGFRKSKVHKIPYPFSFLIGFERIIEMKYRL